MRVVLSVDMEGVSQLSDPREIFAFRPEYWATGKPRIEADTAAAARGLLSGGAREVIVLDNHGGGNPQNVSPESLPEGARLETWNAFELPAQGVDAMLQVGYHARGGTDGFISHTYVPGLRLRLNGEPISESHGRAWAAAVPLIGIIGNDTHRDTLGSLTGTPYLVVQESVSRNVSRPAFHDAAEGLARIEEFAQQSLRAIADAQHHVPGVATFEASMPNGDGQAEPMEAAGWRRAGTVEFAADLGAWSDARGLLAAAMNAAMAPILPHWIGATSAEQARGVDLEQVRTLTGITDAWFAGSYSDWFTAPGVELIVPVRP
jgi:D-aminopeptidase